MAADDLRELLHRGRQVVRLLHQRLQLVAFFPAGRLPGADARLTGPRTHDVDKAFASLPVVGAAQRLAIYGDVFASQLPAPALQYADEGGWLQGHEHVAKHVMGRHPVGQGQKTPQPLHLRLAKASMSV